MEADPPVPQTGTRGTAAVVLPAGRREGREPFRQAVRDALACAAAQGWHDILLSDASFEDWPLGERAVVESLHAWARHGRRMTLLARHYDDLSMRHPRFVQWRQTWSHRIESRGCRQADPLELPSAIWSPGWYLHRLEMEHCTFVCGDDPRRRVELRNALDEWLRRSAPAFSAITLGL